MDYERVLELLGKHYDRPDASPYIRVRGEEKMPVSYYSIEGIERIEAFCRHFESFEDIGRMPRLAESFSKYYEGFKNIPEAVLLTDRASVWTARFYRVTGIDYVCDGHGRVRAYLDTDDQPFVTLTNKDPDDFYGFWKKLKINRHMPGLVNEGMSYWINKALKTNSLFRSFAVDFFLEAAEEEKKYILKDVAHSIENCGCFLLPLDYRDIAQFRTPAALIKSLKPEEVKLSVAFNKVDLNVSYAMIMLTEDIDRRDKGILQKLDTKTLSDSVSLKLLYDGFNTEEFIRHYYINKMVQEDDDFDLKTYIYDYVDMCHEAGEALRFGLDREGLERAHDELAARLRNAASSEMLQQPLVKVPSVFDRLEDEIKAKGLDGFERITTMQRLHGEGEYQHNCVFSRSSLVQRDKASIYHWDYKGASYTIQFSIDTKDRFYVQEVRARFNKAITKEHLADLKALLPDTCIVDDVHMGRMPAIGLPADFRMEFRPLDGEDIPF